MKGKVPVTEAEREAERWGGFKELEKAQCLNSAEAHGALGPERRDKVGACPLGSLKNGYLIKCPKFSPQDPDV